MRPRRIRSPWRQGEHASTASPLSRLTPRQGAPPAEAARYRSARDRRLGPLHFRLRRRSGVGGLDVVGRVQALDHAAGSVPMWRTLPTATVISLVLVAVLATACSGAGVSAPSTSTSPSSTTVRPVSASEALSMTIADVLRADDRFSQVRDLAEQTRTARRGEPSWLETWDSPAETIGEDFGLL